MSLLIELKANWKFRLQLASYVMMPSKNAARSFNYKMPLLSIKNGGSNSMKKLHHF